MAQSSTSIMPFWQDISEQLQTILDRYKIPRSAALAALFGAPVLAIVAPRMLANYKQWISLGPAGVPSTPFGWVVQWTIKLILQRKDTTGTALYDEPWKDKDAKDLSDKEASLNRKNFLPPGKLPKRTKERPVIADFFVPQRELTAAKDFKLQQLQSELLTVVATENPEKIRLGPSVLERQCPALFVAEPLPTPYVARKHKREVCHSHLTADRSSHCTLSYADAKEVIEKGWGERHPGSGSPILGTGYTMLYAPIDESDLDAVGTILRASVGFMTSLS